MLVAWRFVCPQFRRFLLPMITLVRWQRKQVSVLSCAMAGEWYMLPNIQWHTASHHDVVHDLSVHCCNSHMVSTISCGLGVNCVKNSGKSPTVFMQSIQCLVKRWKIWTQSRHVTWKRSVRGPVRSNLQPTFPQTLHGGSPNSNANSRGPNYEDRNRLLGDMPRRRVARATFSIAQDLRTTEEF